VCVCSIREQYNASWWPTQWISSGWPTIWPSQTGSRITVHSSSFSFFTCLSLNFLLLLLFPVISFLFFPGVRQHQNCWVLGDPFSSALFAIGYTLDCLPGDSSLLSTHFVIFFAFPFAPPFYSFSPLALTFLPLHRCLFPPSSSSFYVLCVCVHVYKAAIR
jgi:hypothetical protein